MIQVAKLAKKSHVEYIYFHKKLKLSETFHLILTLQIEKVMHQL